MVAGCERPVRRGEVQGDLDKFDRDGADARRRGIGPGPSAVKGSEAYVHSAVAVQPRVEGPQAGERLAHRSYGVFHCARADKVAAGGPATGPIAVGEEQEKREFVGECGEEGVESQAATEVRPEVPCGPLGGGALTSDAGMCRCLDSAPITAESIPLVGGNMRQDALCGYEVLKWVSRAVSDNCQRRLASSAMVLSGPGM